MQVKLLIKQNNINLNWKLAQPKIRSIAFVSPVHHKLSYRLKILPAGTPAILPPRRIRIRARPDQTNLHDAFHTIKVVTIWTSRTLNRQNSRGSLSYITEDFTHSISCIFCYTKGKGRKNSTFPTVLAKLSLQQGPFLMEKLNKNVLFVAFVNGVLLQKYWRNTELICFK